MSTILSETLSDVRALYVKLFLAEMEEAASQGDVTADCEALDEDGKLATEGPFSLPMRHDLVVIKDDDMGIVEVDSTQVLTFDEVQEQWRGKLTVTVESFRWDACSITVQGGEPKKVSQCLVRWFVEHFRAEAEPGPDGIIGVLHFMSDPERVGNAMNVVVDLGTAPVAALEALFDALVACGATDVALGRPV